VNTAVPASTHISGVNPIVDFTPGPIMTRADRRAVLSATALALGAACLMALTATPAAAAGAPPFCVSRGGGGGEGSAGSRQDCAYYDYQSCLQAAAAERGNCVQNIDYHGEVSTAPAPRVTRHRR
jgi:hypothetical protein